MYEVTKQIQFCYGHRLLAHRGKCVHLHGHNAVAEVTCGSAKLSPSGMVVDFEDIARLLGQWIDTTLDHRMILNKKDDLIPILKKWNEPYFELNGDPTAEAIAKLIFDHAQAQGLSVSKVTLWETPTASATYTA